MFDLGWSEMLVIAVVAIIVVGPRELPGMLRNIGKYVGQIKRMAGDFQRQFNEALKEAELDTVKKDIEAVSSTASKVATGGLSAGLKPVKDAAAGLMDSVEKSDTLTSSKSDETASAADAGDDPGAIAEPMDAAPVDEGAAEPAKSGDDTASEPAPQKAAS